MQKTKSKMFMKRFFQTRNLQQKINSRQQNKSGTKEEPRTAHQFDPQKQSLHPYISPIVQNSLQLL